MVQILYTTTDQIRAALGITEKEVSDAQITDANVVLQLKVDLQDVYPNHADLHATATGGSPTSQDIYLDSVLILYCQYQCCLYLLAAVQMLTVQRISDGDFEIDRFQKDNLQQTIDRITALRDRYRKVLTEATGATTGAVFSQLAVSSPGYDPVLNTGTP